MQKYRLAVLKKCNLKIRQYVLWFFPKMQKHEQAVSESHLQTNHARKYESAREAKVLVFLQSCPQISIAIQPYRNFLSAFSMTFCYWIISCKKIPSIVIVLF